MVRDLFDLSIPGVDLEILQVIRDWSQSSISQALWVQGRFQETCPSDITIVAAKVVSVVRRMVIPFLHFFFRTNGEGDEEDEAMTLSPFEIPEETMAIDFVYSLIRQLINQLPAKVKLSKGSWKSLFRKLDGSLDIFDIALKILRALFEHAPATLFLIVDGVERIEQKKAVATILRVLKFLENMVIKTPRGKVIRVLYTTAGSSEVLEGLDEDFLETVEAKQGRRKHMRGQLGNIQDLEFDSDDTAATFSSSGADKDHNQ